MPPETTFKVMPACWRDLNDLNTIEHACFEEDAWPLLDLLSVLILPGVVRFKAVVDSRMVGFVAGEIKTQERAGWITTIGVLPEYRQRGIAAALLDACEQQMDQPFVRLCVRRSNQSAIRLYQKLNYHQVDVWASYYTGGEDALVFEKRFSE